MMGLRGIWNVNRDDVTPPEQILNRVCYLKAQTWNSARSDNVVAENVGLKSYREDARDFVPDTPGSSDNSDLLRLRSEERRVGKECTSSCTSPYKKEKPAIAE